MGTVARVNCRTITRKFSSALYITGDKAHNNFVVLTPHVDFDEQIKERSLLMNNIGARKLAIDLDKIEKRWNFFKMIDDHKKVLEMTRSEIHEMLNKLKEDPEKNKENIEKLLLHVKLVKDDLKNVKDYMYGVEENAHLAVLSLPNSLHPKTPQEEVTIHTFLQPPEAINQSHIDIGKSQNLIQYTNPSFYFLKSEAALLEFALTNYFQENLMQMGLTQFSNADFATSVVVEGCGIDYLDNSKVFTLDGSNDDLNRLHIVGGGSLYSFMAYFAKHLIQPATLPLKFFSQGRRYTPGTKGSDLFTVSQNSVARIFVATEDDTTKMDEILETLTQELIKVYECLGYHFRAVYLAAPDLEKSESLRVSIQMFSNYSQKYVEVGNLSVYDNYLSKRLLFTYSIDKDRKFLRVLSGEVLNVQKFLACAIENNCLSNKPLLNNVLKKHVQS